MPNIVGLVEAVARIVAEELEPAAAAAAKVGDRNLLSLLEQADHKVGTSLAENGVRGANSGALTDGRVSEILRDESLAANKLPPLFLEGATTKIATGAEKMTAGSSVKEADAAPWAHPLRKSYGFDPLL